MRACSRKSIVAVLCGVAFLAPAAGAQGLEESEIRGLVHDVSGSGIRGAALTLTGSALIGGPRVQYANAVGNYRFKALPPGTYSLSIEAPGVMRIPAAVMTRVVHRCGLRKPKRGWKERKVGTGVTADLDSLHRNAVDVALR